jgi:hypothetical protein
MDELAAEALSADKVLVFSSGSIELAEASLEWLPQGCRERKAVEMPSTKRALSRLFVSDRVP